MPMMKELREITNDIELERESQKVLLFGFHVLRNLGVGNVKHKKHT